MQATSTPPSPTYGKLVNNWQMVDMLRKALSQGDHNFSTVPNLFDSLIRVGGWCHWVNPHTGEEQRWRPHEFRRFIQAPAPEGLATSLEDARRWFIDGSDQQDAFDKALVSNPGQPDWMDQPRSESGRFEPRNCDNITVTDEPQTIPFRSDAPATGTSVSYAIRRLGKQRPDLLEKVKSGEISPHKGMVIAGFAEKAITIPANPSNAGRRLAKHFTPEQFDELAAAFRAAREAMP